jgi:polyhydroxyalkanoate synthesis repressor PhaR
MEQKIRLIKKYKNRRLYDTETSQYITIDDLQRYIIEGLPFRVEDSSTGCDLTTATLLQIVVEMEAGPAQFLSPQVLRQMIVLAHHPLSQFFKTMLQQMMTTMEAHLNDKPYLNDYQNTLDAWNKQSQQLFKQWSDFFPKG